MDFGQSQERESLELYDKFNIPKVTTWCKHKTLFSKNYGKIFKTHLIL